MSKLDQADYYHNRLRYYLKIAKLDQKQGFKKAQEDVKIWLEKKKEQ